MITSAAACTPPGNQNFIKFLLTAYVWMHTIATVLVFNDWLPEWLRGNKQVFEYQILVNYLILNMGPFHDVHYEFFS